MRLQDALYDLTQFLRPKGRKKLLVGKHKKIPDFCDKSSNELVNFPVIEMYESTKYGYST
jgi:hypothetical protein